MTQPDYEQKKREYWEEYWRTHKTYLHGDSAEIVLYETFTDAFDRAYTLSKQTETISQEEIEKAALDYIRTNPFVNFRTATTARESFVDGANFALGKQEIKQESKQETVISGWVARDKNGLLSLFRLYRPERGYDYNGDFGEWGTSIGCQITLPSRLFPDLTWDDDPIEVEIILKRKKK